MKARIFIGTSGYSYDDWRGYFYPAKTAKNKMLEYYAREFSFTEINSTYYHLPALKTMEQLARRTPPHFVFTVKAYRSLTHERGAGADEDARRFIFALSPLTEAGKLGAILLQFPYSFHNREENRRYLVRLRKLLNDVPIAVEFRHQSWSHRAVWELLHSLKAGYVCVDGPALKGLPGPAAICTASIAYVRFHGRNAQKWWRHEQPYERYDYLYTEEELREWVPGIQKLAGKAEKVFVAFNNHFRGQAVENARQMRNLLESTSL